jgi:hypothetical protein
MSNYKETFGEFGVGISPNWQEKLNTPEHIVLEVYGYEVHVFPFSVENGMITRCELSLKHRTTTSPRYHPRPRVFDEYVFPPEPDWFGAHIVLANPAGNPDPGVAYSDRKASSHSTQARDTKFVCSRGKRRLEQLFNTDPALIPRLKIIQ